MLTLALALPQVQANRPSPWSPRHRYRRWSHRGDAVWPLQPRRAQARGPVRAAVATVWPGLSLTTLVRRFNKLGDFSGRYERGFLIQAREKVEYV